MELKWAKRWIWRARGGPPEGWVSKTASDEHGYEILSPESGPRAGAWKASRRRRAARGGAWRAVFRRGFLLRVDRLGAPRNLRFPVGEELARKSHLRQGDL